MFYAESPASDDAGDSTYLADILVFMYYVVKELSRYHRCIYFDSDAIASL